VDSETRCEAMDDGNRFLEDGALTIVAMGWLEESRDGIDIFRPDDTPRGVVAAFSGRGHAPDGDPAPTAFLARRFAHALGLDGTPVHWATQVHGAASAIPGRAERGSAPNAGECDALATAEPGVAVVVQTADCVPVLLAGPAAVGAAHAGWRGSAKGVVGSAVKALERLGAPAPTLSAWIGPAIGACCYEVDAPVIAAFTDAYGAEARTWMTPARDGHVMLDLVRANTDLLGEAGVTRIERAGLCTGCRPDLLYSYRKGHRGRLVTVAAIP